MKGNGRPRGRQTVLRAIGAAAFAATALGGAAGIATAAEVLVPAPAVERLAGEDYVTAPFVAGPDGATWSFTGEEVVRYDRSGALTRVLTPLATERPASELTPQADGGMAIVVGDWRDDDALRLVRVDARGQRARVDRLPRSARKASSFMLEADGTVWYADLCADALYRWRPGSAPSRIRLMPAVCHQAQTSSTLTAGPDGSVWFVNAAQGRVVRRDARGQLRQWNTPKAREWALAFVAADPRGGSIVYAEGDRWGTTGGLITRAGRFASMPTGMPAFAPRGVVWQAKDRQVLSHREGGHPKALPLPPRREASSVTIGRDGRPWFLTGRYDAPMSSLSVTDELQATTTVAGALASWPLAAEGETSHQYGEDSTPLTLGGDGALWTRFVGRGNQRWIVRVVPPGLRAPRKPVARATRLLARNGRTVVLQVRCSAERGRFCRGTVGLGGSAKAVPYVAPGQSGAAVSLTLTRRAAARLRGRGALKITANVRSAGADTTRATVRLRR